LPPDRAIINFRAWLVELRKTLPISLDDLLSVVREFLNLSVSRSGLDAAAEAWRR